MTGNCNGHIAGPTSHLIDNFNQTECIERDALGCSRSRYAIRDSICCGQPPLLVCKMIPNSHTKAERWGAVRCKKKIISMLEEPYVRSMSSLIARWVGDVEGILELELEVSLRA
jgi:hypothetical protein